VRVALIGAGAMGANHARVLRDLEGIDITGVIDRDLQRATAIGRRYGAPFGDDPVRHLESERPDAAVIAVPTSSHVAIALAAIERGVHVLVEKPLAATVEEAEILVDAASANGVTLAVGHIERCNPAVVELKRLLDEGALGRTFMLHSRRLSPFPARIMDVGVAADLATHEVDMMRYLTGAEVEHLTSTVSRVLHPTHEDVVVGLLEFDSGVLGVLEVNWVTPTKIREIHVTGERGMFTVDYLRQELCFYANAASGDSFPNNEWPPTDAFSVAEGPMVRHHIARREPLLVELERFLHAARTGERPVVDGRDGVEAVRLAIDLVAAGTRRPDA
jgi:predicted dehydrogenase